MKIVRIAIALVLTVVLLRIARETSRGHSEHISHMENGYTFEMNSVPKGNENSQARVEVTVAAPASAMPNVQLRYARAGVDDTSNLASYASVPMTPSDSSKGIYFADVSTGARGGKLLYYIEASDESSATRARLLEESSKPLTMRYIGHVPLPVLIFHIGLMFATVFCVSMGAITAFRFYRGSGELASVAKFFMWSTLFAFVGGYPFGFAMNWFAFGGLWEGVPFGTDATDNKTQLLLVTVLFVTLSMLGTLSRGKMGRDLYTPRTLALLGMATCAIMLGIYLIPHSIQFSAALTYGVCYSYIGLFLILYVVGWARAQRPLRA